MGKRRFGAEYLTSRRWRRRAPQRKTKKEQNRDETKVLTRQCETSYVVKNSDCTSPSSTTLGLFSIDDVYSERNAGRRPSITGMLVCRIPWVACQQFEFVEIYMPDTVNEVSNPFGAKYWNMRNMQNLTSIGYTQKVECYRDVACCE